MTCISLNILVNRANDCQWFCIYDFENYGVTDQNQLTSLKKQNEIGV